jgi:hypothetical protein
MPASDPEAIVRRFFHALTDQDDLDASEVAASAGTSIAELRRAVPDLWVTVEDVVTTGGTVVVRWSATGTLRLWPLPDMALDVQDLVHVFQVGDGRIAAVHELGPRRTRPDEDEGEDDDDNGGGPTPAGPHWIPPKPKPMPKPEPPPRERDGVRVPAQPQG